MSGYCHAVYEYSDGTLDNIRQYLNTSLYSFAFSSNGLTLTALKPSRITDWSNDQFMMAVVNGEYVLEAIVQEEYHHSSEQYHSWKSH